jgi:chromosomal replication initiator protein
MISTVNTINLWDDSLKEIESSISSANFNTWFKDTFISKIEDGNIFLAVPSAFVKDWLYSKYHKNILRLLRETLPDIRSLEYVIIKDSGKNRLEEVRKKCESRVYSQELPLSDLYINKEDNLNPKYTFDSFGHALTYKDSNGYSYEYTRGDLGNALTYKNSDGLYNVKGEKVTKEQYEEFINGVPELTMEELTKWLGYDFKIVK